MSEKPVKSKLLGFIFYFMMLRIRISVINLCLYALSSVALLIILEEKEGGQSWFVMIDYGKMLIDNHMNKMVTPPLLSLETIVYFVSQLSYENREENDGNREGFRNTIGGYASVL